MNKKNVALQVFIFFAIALPILGIAYFLLKPANELRVKNQYHETTFSVDMARIAGPKGGFLVIEPANNIGNPNKDQYYRFTSYYMPPGRYFSYPIGKGDDEEPISIEKGQKMYVLLYEDTNNDFFFSPFMDKVARDRFGFPLIQSFSIL